MAFSQRLIRFGPLMRSMYVCTRVLGFVYYMLLNHIIYTSKNQNENIELILCIIIYKFRCKILLYTRMRARMKKFRERENEREIISLKLKKNKSVIIYRNDLNDSHGNIEGLITIILF